MREWTDKKHADARERCESLASIASGMGLSKYQDDWLAELAIDVLPEALDEIERLRDKISTAALDEADRVNAQGVYEGIH